MASIAGFVIGSALASDLSEPERMRLGLVGSLMPSPLVGALIVESLVESEEKDIGDKSEGAQALSAARLEDGVAVDPRLDREQEGDPDELIDVVVRLKEAGVLPEGLIVAAELGDVVTGQIRRRDIRRVHDSDEVESVKTSETLIPERSAFA